MTCRKHVWNPLEDPPPEGDVAASLDFTLGRMADWMHCSRCGKFGIVSRGRRKYGRPTRIIVTSGPPSWFVGPTASKQEDDDG